MIKLVQVTTVPASLHFNERLTPYLSSRGFEVHALSSPGEKLQKYSVRHGVPVHEVEMQRRITPLRDLASIFHIWRYLRQIRPQIVHSCTPKGGLLGMIGAWLAGVPVRIYHIYGLPHVTATGLRRTSLRWSEKVACLFAHQVLCLSESNRELAVQEGFCPAAKIKISSFPNGVDAREKFNPESVGADRRQETRASYGIPDNALVICFVGRIVRDKGVVELTRAWQVLRDEFPILHLLLAGQFEPYDPLPPDVEQILRTDPRVHLAGFVDNPSPVYAASDVFAFPTYREGFCLVAVEAGAMELPVVATSISGVVEAVEDGVTGTLVAPYDAEATANAIRLYLENPELRRRHGCAGRRRALMDFDPETLCEEMYQEYVRLLGKKRLPIPAAESSQQFPGSPKEGFVV
jgi:glycosyltransferase involved in cell wall biosynthesis